MRQSLPWYDLATGIIAQVARSYVPNGGTVVDVGASTGNVGRALASMLEARDADLIAIDASPEMAKVYDAPGVFMVSTAQDFDFAAKEPDLVICFLSMMFVPISERFGVIKRMKDSLAPGGAVVIFDKMIPAAGYLGTVAFRLTLSAKYEAGARPEEVIAKELSIAGLQRPMDRLRELDEFVEVFRFGDFAGWVYERGA